MQVAELSGDALDYWVAKARGVNTYRIDHGELLYDPAPTLPGRRWAPSHFWSQGGPLIEAHHIDLNWDTEGTREWAASIEPDHLAHSASLLEAAMRAFVMSVFGSEVTGAE